MLGVHLFLLRGDNSNNKRCFLTSLRFNACSERKQAKSISKKHRELPYLKLKKKEKEGKRT